MRILQVIDKLDVGGAEKVFIMLTSLLAASNIHTDVLLFDETGTITGELDKRLKVYNLNRRHKYALSSLRRLNSICRAYDIVHVHMRHCFAYTALARKLFGGKYAILLHDHYGDIEIDKNVPLTMRFLKPDVYVGVSASLQVWAIENLKLSKSKTHILRNVIQPVSYHIASQQTPDACMIANIRKTKNIGFAISLFKKLKWPLTIYGHVSDVAYYNEVCSLIDKEECIKIVTDLDGFNDIRNGHNFAIHTALSETGPLVLLEYMSAGIPFLAYKTGEVATVTSADLEELFIENFDEEEWISSIEKIRQDNAWSNKLKDTFNKHFSTEKYLSDCLGIYQSILY